MRNRVLLTLTLVSCVLSSLVFLAPDAGHVAAQEQIRMRLATVAPEGTPWEQQLRRLKQHIESESGGRIRVQMFMGGSLGGEKALVRRIAQGSIQAFGGSTAALGTLVRELNVIEAPYLFDDTATADRVADVCLAVPTPAAAEFLLGQLERTKFAGTRAGDFAKHAVLQLPSDRLSIIQPLLDSLQRVPPAQRLAFAEGLASLTAKPKRTLPPAVDAWMRQELVTAVTERDAAKSLRAITALKPLALAEKAAPLSRVALDSRIRESNRTAALRALPGTAETAATPSNSRQQRPHGLRRAAADLLSSRGREAGAGLSARLHRSADRAQSGVALAKTTGAADLLDLAAAGRVRATLVKHRYVVTASKNARPNSAPAPPRSQSLPPGTRASTPSSRRTRRRRQPPARRDARRPALHPALRRVSPLP